MKIFRWKKYITLFMVKYRKFKHPETSYIFENTLVLSMICSKCENEDEKIFKEEQSIKILKFLV